MGVNKSKRKVLTPGVKATSNSTFGGNVTLAGDLILPAENVTTTGAADTLTNHGVSFITYGSSGVAGDIILPAPIRGAVKEIYVNNATTSVELNINTNHEDNTFWGTTYNTVTISAASTGSPGGTPAGTAYLRLVGHSTTQWAITVGSTFNWDFSGSTGSTDA